MLDHTLDAAAQGLGKIRAKPRRHHPALRYLCREGVRRPKLEWEIRGLLQAKDWRVRVGYPGVPSPEEGRKA